MQKGCHLVMILTVNDLAADPVHFDASGLVYLIHLEAEEDDGKGNVGSRPEGASLRAVWHALRAAQVHYVGSWLSKTAWATWSMYKMPMLVAARSVGWVRSVVVEVAQEQIVVRFYDS